MPGAGPEFETKVYCRSNSGLAGLKTYFSWSSGKDAALALYYLLQDKKYEVGHLLTSVNAFHNRVSMHGLRRELLERQITATGISWSTIELPEEPTMAEYETLMNRAVSDLRQQGFEYAAFGDIFLEDLKIYREQQLASFAIKTVFPLWKRDTAELLHEFIDLGFKAILVCVNAELLDRSFAGRIIDKQFIKDLPAGLDPCGENGEFHSFCFDGPLFNEPVLFKTGEKVYRQYKSPGNPGHTGFWFCDLKPENQHGEI